MGIDIEQTLRRELREVADDLPIPALPPLPEAPPRAHPRWQPLLVAAAVALAVAGAVVLGVTRGSEQPDPAGPTPTPAPTTTAADPRPTAISGDVPRIPYVLGSNLWVEGQRMSGRWQSVTSGPAGSPAWLAQRTDGSWWWGNGPEPRRLEGTFDVPPVLAPSGGFVAELVQEGGTGTLTGFDTRPTGEGLGGIPVDLTDPEDGSALTIRAVTDDGRVVVQSSTQALLWLPQQGRSVDLTKTAPGQQVLSATPAGVVATEGDLAQPYLAELSDDGRLTRIADLPEHDDLLVAPDGSRLVWTPEGTTAGEVTEVPSLETQAVDGADRGVLEAPAGWAFAVRSYAWEDDEHVTARVVQDEGRSERLARCDVAQQRCVLGDVGD